MTSVALISSAGGQGKTTVAVTIAAVWAQRSPTVLVDVDKTKNAGSAGWWIGRAGQAQPAAGKLQSTKTSATELLAHIESLNTNSIVIDTFPGMLNEDGDLRPSILGIAEAVDAVLVTGAATELAEITEAGKTLQENTVTPVAVVLAKTHPSTDAAAWGMAARQALDANGLTVIGSLRRYADLEQAKIGRRLPTTLRRPQIVADIEQLITGLDKWLAEQGIEAP